MPKVIKIQFIDHGIENASYFQGCGVALTEYDTCFTGIGISAISAIDDCLEQAAYMGYKIDRQLEQDALDLVEFDGNSVSESQDDSDNECYYHVSMRLKLE